MNEPLELVFLSFINITFLSVLIGWPAAAVYKKIRHIAPYKSPTLAKAAHAISIFTVIGYYLFIVGGLIGQEGIVSIAVWICTASVALSIPFFILFWREGYWSFAWRVHQSLVTLAGLLFVYFISLAHFF